MSTVDHIILTRFNLPSPGVEGMIRAREGWLRGRIELFERFCVPSVLVQSNSNFSWIVYFDPESPDWLLEKIRPYEAAGVFAPKFRVSIEHDELIGDLQGLRSEGSLGLITTNLDNDDGLAVNFVERLQAWRTDSARRAVFIPNGLIRQGTDVYLRTDRENAFCSVSEGWEEPATCWADWHNLLSQSMPVASLPGPPGWLQVIHGTNVSNRVRGRLTSPEPWVELFPGLLDDTIAPTLRRAVYDRYILQPSRAVREATRAVAKRAALRIVGKVGLDRIKLRLASLSRAVRS
jgi:hypothetical protein